MAASSPYNRLFASDVAFLVLFNGTLDFDDLTFGSNDLMNMLALFKSFRLSEETLEDDGSATWDSGYYPLPYRQRWTCEVEMAVDTAVTGWNYDSVFHLFQTLGSGPYWLYFRKFYVDATHKAVAYAQRGTIKNFAEVIGMDGAQAQTVSFSMWGIPEPLSVTDPDED